ncbi:MAG: sortase [Ruminococcus sp.]|nr:sortase [Ruminococcus sp.]
MNEEINNGAVGSAEEEAARRRAERIKAIRQSLHTDAAAPAETAQAAAPAETAPAEAPAGNAWDDDIAARIAQRVQRVRQNKTSGADDVLAALEAADRTKNAQAAAKKSAAQSSDPAGELLAQLDAAMNAPAKKLKPVAQREVISHAAEAPVQREVISHAAEAPAETVQPVEEIPAEEAVKSFGETAVTEEAPAPAEVPVNAAPRKKKKKKKKRSFKERFLSLFPQKKDSVGERIRKLIFLGALVLIIVCGYQVGDYYIDLWTNKQRNAEVMNMYWTYLPKSNSNVVEYDPDNRPVYTMLDGAKKLLDKNQDVVGVIRIEGTPVNNPVMQSSDNTKYLNQNIDLDESRSGELFLDFRNSFDKCDANGHLIEENSDNLVIYGHNMGNDTMFGALKYYQRNDNYYSEHPVIELNSNYNCYTYKIFAFFILDAEDDTDTRFDCWNMLNFGSEDDFYNFVNEAKRRSIRLNDVDVKWGDKLLTLSTCNTLLGDRGRLIVLARLVRDGEDPYEGTQNSVYNSNIKWPTLYYSYSKNSKRYDPDAEFVPYNN